MNKTGHIAFAIGELRVEGIKEPLGIDVDKPRFSWRLHSQARGAIHAAFRLRVASAQAALESSAADVWDSGIVRGRHLQLDYGGPSLSGARRYWWSVEAWDADGRAVVSPPSFFDTGLYAGDWRAAWIWHDAGIRTNDFAYFRKDIRVRGPVAYAKLFVSAHHAVRAYVGGCRIGGWGSPAPTDPAKRKYYLAYDVTSLLKAGAATIAAVAHYLGGSGQNYVNGKPGFRLQLTARYEDGVSETWSTDDSWETLVDIPHAIGTPYQQNRRLSAIEDYDARKHHPAWMQPGYRPEASRLAAPAEIGADVWPMVWQTIPEGAVEELIAPAHVPETDGGDTAVNRPEAPAAPFAVRQVFDAGKIVSGWPRIVLQGARGTTVRMRYAEALDENGAVLHRVCNEQSEYYYDQYTMRGDGTERWEPDFSYKAFRYVEVTGYPERLVPGTNIWIVSAHTDLAHKGRFHCADERLNRLYEASVQTQKNNALGQLADCPHREQAQYLADADLQSELLLYNFDARHLLEKTLSDFADAQYADGTFPFVAPSNAEHPDFDLRIPEWDLHFCTLLRHVYETVGDERLLARHYGAAKRVTDYYLGIVDPGAGLAPLDRGWHISDWPYPTVDQEAAFLAVQNMKLYRAACIVADTAGILGLPEERSAYAHRAERLKRAIVAKLYDPERKSFRSGLGSGQSHQGVNGLALLYGLVPEEDRASLLRRVADADWEARTVLSLPLLRALFEQGAPEAAYALIAREDYPGWGYMIKHGATTLWEGWDDIESHCHAWNGYPARLLQEYIAGIRIAAPGFDEVRIEPYMPAGLAYAEAAVSTVRGTVVARWERMPGAAADGYEMKISLPAAMRGMVVLPIASGAAPQVRESGSPLWQDGRFAGGIPGVSSCDRVPGGWAIEVASGDYHFTIEGEGSR
ncbi:alpha-L-rhamnosidase [Cohnella sp. OV330]|uniref:alpha-L-rhamnosidase n=1 Tax=Cohnella sp. OV330 TaxID=1855288 RepID=UPI0008ECF781|nr:alpha-L-rhamnosidase [Cohnella sp. OV330]SFB39191.1 alpha-L-rhamnosidase [Cohnella sp. OV330]